MSKSAISILVTANKLEDHYKDAQFAFDEQQNLLLVAYDRYHQDDFRSSDFHAYNTAKVHTKTAQKVMLRAYHVWKTEVRKYREAVEAERVEHLKERAG